MKSEQVIKERLKSAKQEYDIIDMLLRSCDKAEQHGFCVEKARKEAEVKTLEWILE